MAIDRTILRMLMTLQERFALSGSILTFGVQDVMLSHENAEELFRNSNYRFTPIEEGRRRYSKSKLQTLFEDVLNVKKPMHLLDLLTMMNFEEVASLDAFDAENPTILHDLNKPIPDTYKGKFDVVLDIGVMEHVFDVKQFIQNCIHLLKDQGVLILFVPLLGWHNECFYNFQPPFFFDVFSANGFRDISVYLNFFPKYHDFGEGRTTWLEFQYGDRVQFKRANYNTCILFVGRKSRTDSDFVVPLQSFYEEYYQNWKAAQGTAIPGKPEASHYLLDNMPRAIRKLFRVLVPIYRVLPPVLRTPIVDALIYLKNRSRLAGREKVRY